MTVSTKRLLIIDDEEDLREVLTSLLEQENLEIQVACNGQEAIEKISKNSFDAILSDEKMPKKSGLEVLKWMKDSGINTPFIIHSGYGESDLMEEALRMGVFAFIDKPWDEKKLIATVQEALNTPMAS